MQEKRRHYRKPISLTIELVGADGKARPGACRDVSLSGAHLALDDPPRFEESVVVRFPIGPGGAMLAYPSIVRWTKPGEVGVQFGLLGARETYAVTELIAKS